MLKYAIIDLSQICIPTLYNKTLKSVDAVVIRWVVCHAVVCSMYTTGMTGRIQLPYKRCGPPRITI